MSIRNETSVNNFLHKYRAQAKQRYMRQVEAPTYVPYSTKEIFPYYDIKTRDVPAVELLISEEDLEQLIKIEQMGEEIARKWGPDAVRLLNEAHTVLREEAAERRVRNKNPAVEKAWDKYQMLLKIVGE